MKMRRLLAVLAIVFAALLSFTGTAGAQTTSGGTSVGGTDNTPDAGQTITVSGTGCKAGETVNFFFDGEPAGSTTADENGNFSGPVTVPPDASPGPHTITAQCGAVVMAFEIEVNPAAVAAAPIPRTGSSSTIPLTSIALALLGAGGLFVLFARRRRVTHQPA
jgi:LPXTG-motif cell wall-anchored protein